MPYRARVNERTLLNLPGFHGGAFVYVYVEDTSLRELCSGMPTATADCDCCPQNFEPHMVLEIADCNAHDRSQLRHRYRSGSRELAAQAGHAHDARSTSSAQLWWRSSSRTTVVSDELEALIG